MLQNGNWLLGITLYAIILVIISIVIFVINRFDKDKVTKDAIESIKWNNFILGESLEMVILFFGLKSKNIYSSSR